MTKRRAIILRDRDGLLDLIDDRWHAVAERRTAFVSREQFLRAVLRQALGAPGRDRSGRKIES